MANLSGTRTTAALLSARSDAIATPPRLDLASLQGLANNTRARFVRIEQLVNRLYDLLGQSGSDSLNTIAQITSQLSQLAAQVAALESGTATEVEDDAPPADLRAMAAVASLSKRIAALEEAPPSDARWQIDALALRVSVLEEAP